MFSWRLSLIPMVWHFLDKRAATLLTPTLRLLLCGEELWQPLSVVSEEHAAAMDCPEFSTG